MLFFIYLPVSLKSITIHGAPFVLSSLHNTSFISPTTYDPSSSVRFETPNEENPSLVTFTFPGPHSSSNHTNSLPFQSHRARLTPSSPLNFPSFSLSTSPVQNVPVCTTPVPGSKARFTLPFRYLLKSVPHCTRLTIKNFLTRLVDFDQSIYSSRSMTLSLPIYTEISLLLYLDSYNNTISLDTCVKFNT